MHLSPAPTARLAPRAHPPRWSLTGPFYIGIGVCAHNKDAIAARRLLQRAGLSSLRPKPRKPVLVSALETVPIASTDRHVEYVAAAHFEAPNWSRDGSALVFNQDGVLHRLALGASQPTAIDTAPQTRLQQRSRHLA